MLKNNLPVLIIPAYNPDRKLVHLLSEHNSLNNGQKCIIVNDGSYECSNQIFKEVEALGYVVLTHAKNQGKGAALKTAMNFYLMHWADLSPGVITADADGQHTLNDIIRLSTIFLDEPNKLHLGVRHISRGNIPLRSRLGNVITKFLFNALTSNRIKDTQTGLRAIPNDLIKYIIMSKTHRYEFEFEMFFVARKHHFKIRQIPIETIYIDNNISSHFNPLLDSLRIYFVFIRFCCVGLCSFLLDFSIFALLYHSSHDSAFSLLGARLVSVPFNFFLNKNISFKYKNTFFQSALMYLVLSLVIGVLSLELMTLIHFMGLNIYFSKVSAELLMFMANFSIQYLVVFAKKTKLAEVH